MKSIFDNGGIIGPTMDFLATDRYVVGSTSGLATIEYVGGIVQNTAGQTSDINISLSGLTGGLATAPEAGDLVVIAVEMCGTTNKSYRIGPDYNQIVDLYANDTEDSNFQVGYKFMGETPDANATLVGGTDSTADGCAIAIHVWRNVDSTTPLDVTPTTNIQTNTGIPNPPAITPSTSGSVIIVAAGTAHTGGTDTYTAAYLDNFLSTGRNGTNDATVGMGSINWTSGSYDPATWGWSQADSTNFSTNSVSFALRPATVVTPEHGNLKNSGIWSVNTIWKALQPEENPFGPNVIAAWDPFSGGNSSGFIPNAIGTSIPLWVRDQSSAVINWDGVFNERELLILDGSDVQANITNQSSITISLWYYWATSGSNPSNGSPIIGHGDGWPGGGATPGSFHLGSDFNGSVFLAVEDGYYASDQSVAGLLTRDTWHFLAMTAGAGGWKVYLNGSEVLDVGITRALPNINRVLGFGAYWILIENTQTVHTDTFSNHFDYYWAGNMGDIRIHNKTLDSTEVSALYAAGRLTY